MYVWTQLYLFKNYFSHNFLIILFWNESKSVRRKRCQPSLKVEELITNFSFTTELGQTLSSQKKRFIKSFLGLFHLFDSIIHEYCQWPITVYVWRSLNQMGGLMWSEQLRMKDLSYLGGLQSLCIIPRACVFIHIFLIICCNYSIILNTTQNTHYEIAFSF